MFSNNIAPVTTSINVPQVQQIRQVPIQTGLIQGSTSLSKLSNTMARIQATHYGSVPTQQYVQPVHLNNVQTVFQPSQVIEEVRIT